MNYRLNFKLFSILITLPALILSCTPVITSPPVETPTVDFMAEPVEGEAPQTVTFTALVKGDVSAYYWDFGDGQSSSQKDPEHIYDSEGVYTVVLVAEGGGGFGVEKKDDYVTIIGVLEEPVKEVVDWADAGNYIGQSKTVDGIIKSTYYASNVNGRPTFLNFNIPYEGYFTCLIWSSDRSKFVNNFHDTPESYLLNKHVQVTGVVTDYPEGSGVPEMILTDPSQLIILDN